MSEVIKRKYIGNIKIAIDEYAQRRRKKEK